ncbi:hypothetical protein [Aestuariivita sp.]|jgi:nitrogen regulatory protein PII|uniref:P-II family nitrogen regulator n=1 Tax=Aestuariivita sp. TaxID=1872407 RepID=UPI002171F91E|nr:hypothetical protein [Aestuariivita sp.]MCE8007235.1 hypothetical protein [Aestuariivita sp.]
MYTAQKVVIITERVILDRVAEIIEAQGATGYTHVSAGGKGSRGKRSSNRPGVSGISANVKIEVIVGSLEMAEAIADAVAGAFFDNYSGITYVEEVQILRPHKFLRIDD